ncbi:hypothetical protein TRVA0_059S00540 [Trichomonascus vanleenenianus]|uniref:uncharacterized protein n=1 Tax=Trichomonascus vanleenenianus TaxID=2268995 RepID=UPI003ECA5A2A
MSEVDETEPPNKRLCSVCLENLPPPLESAELLATLGCGHSYHDLCIKTWAERTNSCPSCRARFHEIALRREFGGAIVHTIGVPDKEAPKVENVEEEHEQLAREYAHQFEEPFGDIENCVICASGEREQELLVCDGCDRTFHVTCLGLGEVPFSDWFCPTCEVDGESAYYRFANETAASGFDSCEDEVDDYDQDCNTSYGRLIESIIRDFERPRTAAGRRRRPAVPSSRRRGGRSISRRAFAETREQVRRTRQQTRSVVDGGGRVVTPGEEDRVAISTVVYAPQAPQVPAPVMSPEEVEAWEMLEKAQHLDEMPGEPSAEPPAASSSAVLSSPPTRKLKRPTRKTRAESSTTKPSDESNLVNPSDESNSGNNHTMKSGNEPSSAKNTIVKAESSSSGGSLVQSLLSNIRNAGSSSIRFVGVNNNNASPASLGSNRNSFYSSVSSPEQSTRQMSMSPPESRATSLSPPESRAMSLSPPESRAMSMSPQQDSSSPPSIASPPPTSEIPVISLESTRDIPRSPLRHATAKRLPAWFRPRSHTVGSAPVPATAINNSQLSLEQKERVQSLVRDALRPMYRSGKIDKAQYTRINKRVSRQMYERLRDLADDLTTDTTSSSNDLSRYKDVVRDFVKYELEDL